MALEYLSHLARLDTRDIHPGGSAASQALLQALAIEPGQRVLEVGCGTASTLERVCQRCTAHVVGLDLLQEMLVRARRRLSAAGILDRVLLVRGSAERIPFRSATFSAVYCESVLGFQKTQALRTVLREIHRVLQPGGRLVANEAIWRVGVDDALVQTINAACEKDFGLPQATESAWALSDWLRELAAAGFVLGSHELLSNLVGKNPSVGRRPIEVGAALRHVATWLSPTLIADRLRYRRLLVSYRPLSEHVEGRLFVATRPERPPAGAN